MSSPNIPGELRNVHVEAISLVTKAANGKTFKIFKAADPKQTAPDTPERDEQGLFSVLKKFFTGETEIQKSGRKISSARLAELRAAQAALTKVIEESEDSEGGAAVEKQELENIVKSVIEGAIKPLGERIEKLESVGEPEDKASELTELVKSAVTEAISPLEQRISKVESARGFSNKVPEDTSVRKGEGGIWEGLF